MRILGIETSCDETGAAVLKKKRESRRIQLHSNVIVSSLDLHAKTGGIIPEIAAREQIKFIIPVIEKALSKAGLSYFNIDAIAVTFGPGLIGSLLVGIETAKTLSYAWSKPLIPVNHLIGHIYANWIDREESISFPALALIVSGGHTDLVLVKDHGKIKWLGGTRDDAAGEAFDKIARLLGLPYPGGAVIEKTATNGNPKRFNFPRPIIDSNDFDFSFSGLKTAVLREVQRMKKLDKEIISDIALEVQNAIIEVLVAKTLKAARQYKVKSILLAGGVAANQKLRDEFKLKTKHYLLDAKIFVPQKSLCTDNGAMIASAAFLNYKEVPWQKLTANPELYFE